MEKTKKTEANPPAGGEEKKSTIQKPFKKPFGRAGRGPRGGRKFDRPKDEFEQKIVDLSRVTRVMAGGKRMKFRATMVIGDKKGNVGIGVAKGADVAMAIQKSVAKAKKSLVAVPIIDGTIPHEMKLKRGAARIIIKPAKLGSGIKAGGVLRIVLELAGIKDVTAKILGTNNKLNNAKAAIAALNSFMPAAVAKAKPKAKPVTKNDKAQVDTNKGTPSVKDQGNKK